jgi:hypothetical protein
MRHAIVGWGVLVLAAAGVGCARHASTCPCSTSVTETTGAVLVMPSPQPDAAATPVSRPPEAHTEPATSLAPDPAAQDARLYSGLDRLTNGGATPPVPISVYAEPPKHEFPGSSRYSDVGMPYPLPDIAALSPAAPPARPERSEPPPPEPSPAPFLETSF